MIVALWMLQALLALLFLFAGVVKLITPMEEMLAQMPFPLPPAFLLFIGVAEILGALGLVLPGLLRIRQELTPLAAAGLSVVMMGATILTAVTLGPTMALIPLVVGLLTTFVAYARWRLAPAGASRRRTLRPSLARG